MTTFGLLLVLTAAACHATWNFCVKKINAGPELIWLFSVVAMVIYLPLAGWIIVVERPVFTVESTLFTIGSAVLHLGYFLLLQAGYRKGDLSLVYPTARATGPILSTTFAIVFLGEIVSTQLLIGAVIIIAGVLFLTGGIRAASGNLRASLLFGLAAGSLIGSYTVWDAYAVSVLLVPPLLLDYVSSVGRAVMLAPVARRRWPSVVDLWNRHRGLVVITAVFNPLAYILVLYALTFTPVAYVAPAREVSVLLSVLAGSLLLGEGRLRQRLGWAAVILAGMTILVGA